MHWRPLVAVPIVLAACAGSEGAELAPTTVAPVTVASTTTVPVTSVPTTTVPPTVVATTTIPPTTVAATMIPPTTVAPPAETVERTYDIGQSVEGRPITVVERGTPGGKVVMVVGVIHGNETAGVEIVRDLAAAPVPDGIHLYLVESMNPDGQAHDIRTNAHQVDLNRNFPLRWAPLGAPGDWQYAGTGPASEPETEAMVALINEIRPELAVWYHQDLNRLSPATGAKGELVRRYADLTGLPIVPVTGGTYTGTATPWQEDVVDGSAALLVELGPALSADQAATHAAAVFAVAAP